jgi:hypothetical protein
LNASSEILLSFTDFNYAQPPSSVTVINPDGTYFIKTQSNSERNLRSYIQEGDSYLILCLISSLVKLTFRGCKINNLEEIASKLLSSPKIEKNTKDVVNLWLSSPSNISSLIEKPKKSHF